MSSLQFLSNKRRHLIPFVDCILLSVESIKPSVPHLDRLRVDLGPRIDFLQRVVPTVSKILTIPLAQTGAGKPQLLIGAGLEMRQQQRI